jgi:hypothetical protein
MPAHFDLVITADDSRRTAEFTLRDSAGVQIAYRQTDFKPISVSHQQGLFDLRNYLRLYVEEGKERAAMAEIGVCIAQDVLGQDIFAKLWASQSQRTLRIQLPGAADTENILVAALARIPWEIATPSAVAGAETLSARNLVVRVVHNMQAPASTPIELRPDEALRVLFVFAEARGSRPLGARKERRALLHLFEKEIYPQRRVVAHFLTHGVTRERLASQVAEQGGYHVVHWSGHGHMNLLELSKPGGASDRLSGGELLDIFNDAGGFLPRLFFLSACHSGDILRVKDWSDFLAVAQGKEPGTKESISKDIDLKVQPGFTGTAHALLQGGVPSVVAMRYAVGDDYARELSVEFYRALLAHTLPKDVAAALTMARRAMLDPSKQPAAHFAACDHATPLLYGEQQLGITLIDGRGPECNPRNPRLHNIAELTTADHMHFVGRTWELVGLGADFMGSKAGAEVKPIAVITGLGGMGKTALTAEALALSQSRFEWVLLYQAKPNALGFDATLRDIHIKLMGELKRYHDHVRANNADAIYRDATADFTGPARLERLTRNLLRAMKDEAILLVLDNFEGNLKPTEEPSAVAGQPVWACQDAAWDNCLKLLAKELIGSPSRILITCRRPLAALVDDVAHAVLLGPLPGAEAALYLRQHPALNGMIFGGDDAEKALAFRLLNASRFHPLLMDRLAKLAASAALRTQLLAALEALEKTKDFAQLPALFATKRGDTTELAYLDDALAASLDQLICDASGDARRLLWVIALANQPEALELVKAVWGGESDELQQLRQVKRMLARLPTLPPELQAKLTAVDAPNLRAVLDALPPSAPTKPDLDALLSHLVRVGLVTEQRDDANDSNLNLACHELVRERIVAWMDHHSEDRNERTANDIRLAYADWLVPMFESLQHKDTHAAIGAGSRALVYCVQADAWDRVGDFTSALVTSASDPHVLKSLIPHLQTAADTASEGAQRWRSLCNLADALMRSGCPDLSLPLYEQAAAQARAVADAAGSGSRRAWSDFAAISGNWAISLRQTGDINASRQRRLDSADGSKKAGLPAIHALGAELEVLRIDLLQDRVETAWPQVESRLAQVKAWWQQARAGEVVPEAPDTEFLARCLIGALCIASGAHHAKEDWSAALSCAEAVIEVEEALDRPQHTVASSRMIRAGALTKVGRFSEARAELEACLRVFATDPKGTAQTRSCLAFLCCEQDDIAQAIMQERHALAVFEQLPYPSDRARSHCNLANYVSRRGNASDVHAFACHRLAALIYLVVLEAGTALQTMLHNYAVDFLRSDTGGTPLVVPRVVVLLADPAFTALEQWLSHSQVDIVELQAEVDEMLEQVRKSALAGI